MKVSQILVGEMANFTYILADEESGEAAVIDPSWDLEKIFDILKKYGWRAKFIINTHTHFDHVLGNERVANVTGAKVIQYAGSSTNSEIRVNDGELISVGSIKIKVLHTPGHSRDSMCLIANRKLIFTGDTLFVGNCGRVDLPGGNPEQMYHSLYDKIANLDESLIVYPGHDYGSRPFSTIAQEKKTNYVLLHRSKKEFLGFMASDE